MKLLSIQVSLPKSIQYKREYVTTGIFKTPVEGRVMLRSLNLDGDRQADLSVHGGTYKAVYVYPSEHYPLWKAELGRDDLAGQENLAGREKLAYGQFGENFTVEGLLEDAVYIGDVFRIGGAVVQVTEPRMPCYKLDIKMEKPGFGKPFLKSERSGFYLRVLEEGEVGAGDTIELVSTEPHQVSIRKFVQLYYKDREDYDSMRRLLEIESLDPSWRGFFEECLMEAEDA